MPKLLSKINSIGKLALLALGSLVAFFLLFAEIADEVEDGDLQAFDRAILLAFRNPSNLSDPIGPGWLEEMMRDFTSLGSVTVLLTITLIVVGFLFLTKKRHSAWVIALSLISGLGASNLLKWLFARPRPDLVPHAAVVYTQSFPSGHAMLSAVVYLTLGALLVRTQADPRVKAFIMSASIFLTTIVGISRVYLGVHWPSDVLAGWTIGAGWALLCWIIMAWLQSRKKIEQPSQLE